MKVNEYDVIRQVIPPEPDIDHKRAEKWTRDALNGTNKADLNMARAYLELSDKR